MTYVSTFDSKNILRGSTFKRLYVKSVAKYVRISMHRAEENGTQKKFCLDQKKWKLLLFIFVNFLS